MDKATHHMKIGPRPATQRTVKRKPTTRAADGAARSVHKYNPAEDCSHQNLKRLRTLKGMTLRDLSKSSGLSVSYLSNYESGKANITISTLKKIAHALGVTTSDLLTDGPDRDIVVVPRENRYIRELYAGESGIAYQEYMMRSNAVSMHVSIARLPPHSDTGELASHYGEEFVFVLKGNLCVILNGKPHEIEEGSMAYYNSSICHTLANTGDFEVEYLHVNTPPTY